MFDPEGRGRCPAEGARRQDQGPRYLCVAGDGPEVQGFCDDPPGKSGDDRAAGRGPGPEPGDPGRTAPCRAGPGGRDGGIRSSTQHRQHKNADQYAAGDVFDAVETQTLIVTDYAYRMERIRQLLDLVDVEGKKKQVERRIQFYKASEIAPKIETMASHLGTVSVSISAVAPAPTPCHSNRHIRELRLGGGSGGSGRGGRTGASAAAAAAGRSGGGKPATEDSVQLETDDRTNRMFIIGTDENIKIVNEIIDSLDIPQKSIRTIQEYKIQYIDTTEVVNTLFELGVIKKQADLVLAQSSARPRLRGHERRQRRERRRWAAERRGGGIG